MTVSRLYIRRARWPTGWLKWLAVTFRMVVCFADMYILAAAVAAGWFVSPKRPNRFSRIACACRHEVHGVGSVYYGKLLYHCNYRCSSPYGDILLVYIPYVRTVRQFPYRAAQILHGTIGR